MIINNTQEQILKYDWSEVAEFNPNNYALVFQKPVFDMAFIFTHDSLMSKISSFQSYFQSKHKFTTHCIYLKDISKLEKCLSDLKSHEISYSIVLNKNCEEDDSYDLYILHRNEAQIEISIKTVDFLISNDFTNLMDKVKILKSHPFKSPHPTGENKDGSIYMNDELRYYFCLLSDSRILSLDELSYVNEYLLHRKELLEQTAKERSNAIKEIPVESRHQGNIQYYVYEPSSTVQVKQAQSCIEIERNKPFQPSKFVFKGPNRTSSIISAIDVEPPENYKTQLTVESGSSNTPDIATRLESLKKKFEKLREKQAMQPSRVSRWDRHIPLHRKPTVCKAKIIRNKFSKCAKTLKVDVKTTNVSTVAFDSVKARIANCHSKKKDNSHLVKYSQSSYSKKAAKLSESNSSHKLPESNSSHKSTHSTKKDKTPQHKRDIQPVKSKGPDVIDLTEDDGNEDDSKNTSRKRHSNDPVPRPSKVLKPDTDKSTAKKDNTSSTQADKSIADNLLNLFRLIMNVVPFNLPTDNAICKILSKYCIIIQEGIKEPSLKNVSINYDTCKSNGVNEIITNINAVFNESKKNTFDASYMIFIWNMYFPSNLQNNNLMIMFYRFVKLLMLYTMFNVSSVTKKLVSTIIGEIDIIVNFDFNSPVLSFRKHQLQCFSTIFDKYFKEHDQLHVLYSNLSSSDPLPLPDKRKKLDKVIKQKKMEFVIGPLLNYFVISINSIPQKMETYQIEIIYGAIRTLRFCLRKINSKLAQVTFNKPKPFDFTISQRDNHYNEILRELKFLLQEIKYYQCILFTEKHYEFINCLLDFSWMIEGNLGLLSDPSKSKVHDSLFVLDSSQFIESFTSFDHPILLPYHPESELEYLRLSLKNRWADILRKAFIGTIPEPSGWRIIKEMKILLPNLWGPLTFQEAIDESSKLYFADFQKIAEVEPLGWYQKFFQSKDCAIVWLTKYNLPVTSLELFYNHQRMLESKFANR